MSRIALAHRTWAPAPRTPDGKPDLSGLWPAPTYRSTFELEAFLARPLRPLPAAYRGLPSRRSRDQLPRGPVCVQRRVGGPLPIGDEPHMTLVNGRLYLNALPLFLSWTLSRSGLNDAPDP